MLFKYSALAAATFFVTVNLFGGVLLLMRTSQRALGEYTNPDARDRGGTFDTLDTNAEEYVTTGKELFVPTLEQTEGQLRRATRGAPARERRCASSRTRRSS